MYLDITCTRVPCIHVCRMSARPAFAHVRRAPIQKHAGLAEQDRVADMLPTADMSALSRFMANHLAVKTPT